MLATFFDFGDNFASSTLGIMGSLVTDLSPMIILIISVLLTVVVVKILIGALHK